MPAPLQRLPIDEALPQLLAALRTHACVVLRAPTGAGKTTRVPTAVLDAGLAGAGQVVMLEPRRVAARAAARRMAQERGGELGEAWRLAGKDANKPNSWRDLIACAEDLIARGNTTKNELFVFSGSAGGITLGRALTERPDLFAGVIAIVPGVNTLRQEFQPVGPLNIPEFGTIKTEEGFRNLYEMDTLQHVRSGVQYPAALITTGLNDPRVSPWEPAKFAAALQGSGSERPILLRIDAEAGHGFGNTKSQDDALYADMWAFVFWRAGLPEWQPRFSE